MKKHDIITIIVLGMSYINYAFSGYDSFMYFIMIMIYVQLRLDSHPNNPKFNK